MSFLQRPPRHWFDGYEGRKASPAERGLLVILAYAIGGLGYPGANRLVGQGPHHSLALASDRAIPFLPPFVFIYDLVYVAPALSVFFMRDRAELYRALLAFGLNSLICFPIFLVFPVGYPRLAPLPDTISGRVLAFVHVLDQPVNCFPSHHVSTAFTTWLAVRRQNRSWGALFGLIAAGIAVSTLFVKQHYIVDVPAGIAVAALTYGLSFPRDKRPKRLTSSG